eukprot:PITA_34337
MAWSMEYAVATLTLGLLVIILFKMNASSGLRPPIAATMVGLLINFKRLPDFILHHHRRHKTYRIVYPTFVFTADPANVEHILRSNFANYIKGNYIHDVFEELIGDGIFGVDGEQWKQQRKLASLEFSTKVLKNFSSVVFRETAVKFSKKLLEARRAGQTVEMQGLFLTATMDGFCKLGFGVDINSPNTNFGELASFASAFDAVASALLWRSFDVAWKLKKYFNILSEATVKANIKTLDDFVYKVKPDLLSRFIALTEKQPEKYSDKYLRDVIMNFMIAGRDTTAGTLCWFFHLLCKYPDVEKKLLQEIHDVVKENECVTTEESITMFSQSLTNTVLNNMHYLQATLSETIRLFPPVAMDGKEVLAEDILPDGFKVKKGDIVCYVPYSMGRMTDIWGSDTEEFRPERWLHNGIFLPQSPFKFTAFQAGPRICLGKDFAYLQMKIVAAVLLRFFKFESVEGMTVRYHLGLSLRMSKDVLNLHVKPRLD